MGSKQPDQRDYWPCACTKGREATLRIKLNHKSINKCRTCKVERPDDSWFQSQETAQPTEPRSLRLSDRPVASLAWTTKTEKVTNEI